MDNLTNQMRIFILGEAHKPKGDFNSQIHKPHECFLLAKLTNQTQTYLKDIRQEKKNILNKL